MQAYTLYYGQVCQYQILPPYPEIWKGQKELQMLPKFFDPPPPLSLMLEPFKNIKKGGLIWYIQDILLLLQSLNAF